MAIQHLNIPDAQLHEAKGAAGAANKNVMFADGAGGSAWRTITESELSYATKANNRFGWNDVADSAYTSGSPRAISSGVRTQLTNNGLATQTDTSRLGALWNTGTNVLLINDLNAAYDLRIAMKATVGAASGTPYTMLIELESATGSLIYAAATLAMKGGGSISYLNFSLPFYVGTYINNVNTTIYITPDTNTNIYDIGLFLRRAYKES
jgi:hypothetical protein